jgi:ATP-dependent RNA helicase CshB
LIVGGTDRERQIDKMKNPPQLIIGTPGRILDLMKAQALFPHKVTHFVVDEADQMLDMGFLPEVDRIAQSLPEKLQTMVFSATIPEKLEPFLKRYLHDPRFAEASPEHRVAPKIKHHVIPVRHRDRKELTVEIAKAINPFVCLVFTNTKQEADELETSFREAGLNVGTLHGDMQARRRKQAIKDINDAKYQYVIATDLAARGIDISGVSHVINHGIPKDLDFYTHRVGRTGRAGASGEAYTLYEDHENGPINRLEERGFEFTHVDLRNGSIQPIKTRRRRQTDRKMKVSHTAHSRMAGEIKKAKKKVKPGYKKKFKYKLKETASREHMQQQRSDRRAARKKNKR